MKIIYIDLINEYAKEDEKDFNNITYIHEYNRIIIENVKEVVMKDGFVKVYFTKTPRAKIRNSFMCCIGNIKNMVIN